MTFFSIIKDSDHIYYVPALLTMVWFRTFFSALWHNRGRLCVRLVFTLIVNLSFQVFEQNQQFCSASFTVGNMSCSDLYNNMLEPILDLVTSVQCDLLFFNNYIFQVSDILSAIWGRNWVEVMCYNPNLINQRLRFKLFRF